MRSIAEFVIDHREPKSRTSPYQNRIRTPSVEPIEVAARAKSRCPKLLKSQRTP
jgi:hypothetical protein